MVLMSGCNSLEASASYQSTSARRDLGKRATTYNVIEGNLIEGYQGPVGKFTSVLIDGKQGDKLEMTGNATVGYRLWVVRNGKKVEELPSTDPSGDPIALYTLLDESGDVIGGFPLMGIQLDCPPIPGADSTDLSS